LTGFSVGLNYLIKLTDLLLKTNITLSEINVCAKQKFNKNSHPDKVGIPQF